MSGVLVVAESRRGEPRDITFELAAVAAGLGAPMVMAVVGHDADQLAGAFACAGVDEIVAVPTTGEAFEPHLAVDGLQRVVEELEPSVVLVGQTVDGAAIGPALAVRLGAGFASNVVSAEQGADGLRARRGAYGDRLLAEVAFDAATVVLMVRAGGHEPAPRGGDVPVRVLGGVDSAPTVSHLSYQEAASDGVDITKSDFLVSIGRGIGEQEHVERFAGLAERIGGTLSASRPLIDAGWLPSARQVGQSGRTVKPKVYLALGISGAVQHLAGMRDADTIVAVNTDPEAPIFSVADVGAVADVHELADALERHF